LSIGSLKPLGRLAITDNSVAGLGGIEEKALGFI
jgi:hypothetical protein